MPYCTACGDSFPFLEAETCNGCTALDQCATTEEKTNLMEIISSKTCRGCSAYYLYSQKPLCGQCVRKYTLLITSGKPAPIEFNEKAMADFLSSLNVLSTSSPTQVTTKTLTPTAPSGPHPSGGASLGATIDAQTTANLMFQAAPFVQRTASTFRIGQPKTNTMYSSLSPTSNALSLTNAKHFSDLWRQQGKLLREGTIKILGFFFLARRGCETDMPMQIGAISILKAFTLITPMVNAFQEVFVLVRDALTDVFPALDVGKVSMASLSYSIHITAKLGSSISLSQLTAPGTTVDDFFTTIGSILRRADFLNYQIPLRFIMSEEEHNPYGEAHSSDAQIPSRRKRNGDLVSADSLRIKRKSVAAESAFIGAAGQCGLILPQRPRALTYSSYSGSMTEVVCAITTLSIDKTGRFSIASKPGLRTIHVASITTDETSAPAGPSTKPIYGTGLLGFGKTKRVLFGTFIKDNVTIPIAICESKFSEPTGKVHYKQMVEEAKLLVLGESLCKAFFLRVHGTEQSGCSNRLNFKIATFRYNTEDLFVGVIPEDRTIPSTGDGGPIFLNTSFIATNFLHHNPARGDSSFIRITGNNPAADVYDNSALSKTLNAFSHFTFVHTGACHLLVDYQGFWERGSNTFVLIDAQGHSVTPHMFWDKGPDALAAFVENHKCNSLCRYLDLDDLESFNVDDVAAQARALQEAKELEGSLESTAPYPGVDDISSLSNNTSPQAF